MAAYTEQDILDACDAAQETYLDWPEFGNVKFDHLSARLIVCRDEARWALIFNTIAWHTQEGMDIQVLPVGNCVSVPLGSGAPAPDEDYIRLQVEAIRRRKERFDSSIFGGRLLKLFGVDSRKLALSDEQMTAQLRRNHPTGLEYDAKVQHLVEMDFDDDDGEKEWGYITRFTLRGEPIPFRELKVQPELKLQNEPAFWVALAATEAYRERMLATDEELARYFDHGLPPKLLVLDDWCHGETEHPSESETFQMLARAMVTGDASVYRPQAMPNTHWRNWIEK
jgi:hypothetical protein